MREIEDVVTIERLPAAEHQDGISEIGYLLDDFDRTAGGKVSGRTELGGGGTTMNATKVAALGDFPENQAWLELRCIVFLAGTCCQSCFHDVLLIQPRGRYGCPSP